MFGEGKAYVGLFLPEHLLTQNSIVRRLVGEIPEEDWREIEVLGWLYQFYISERKAEVMAGRGAYEARDIPAATQLFTPHWIVRYMVENSVGRLWLEAHPESGLREKMPYFLEAEGGDAGEGEVGFPGLRPEDLTVMDPACGSGHILVYAFDLLFEIYREQGYAEPRIARLILENNLFGLDIDERAVQLACFALLMKARERDRRVLRDPPALGVAHTVATRGWVVPDVPELRREDWQPLLDAFVDADNLGSLIDPPEVDLDALESSLLRLRAVAGRRWGGRRLGCGCCWSRRGCLRSRYLRGGGESAVHGERVVQQDVEEVRECGIPAEQGGLVCGVHGEGAGVDKPMGAMGMINQHAWMFLKHASSDLTEATYSRTSICRAMLHLGSTGISGDWRRGRPVYGIHCFANRSPKPDGAQSS